MPISYAQVRPMLRTEILARVAAGERLKAICREAGMPCPESVTGWARRDPEFAEAYRVAKLQGDHRRRLRYDEAVAKAIVARLAAGERIDQALKHSGMPSWPVFMHWRRTQAEFQAEVARQNEIKDQEKAHRCKRPWRGFDQALADRIVARVWQGQSLRRVLGADKALPCLSVVARWRAESPSFDQALRGAMRTSRFQQGARRLWSEELQAEIVGRIIEGGSLRSIAADRAMPSAHTLYNWVATKPDFAAAVARACRHREDWYRDNMFEIAKAATEATLASDLKRLSQFRRQEARLRHRPGREGK